MNIYTLSFSIFIYIFICVFQSNCSARIPSDEIYGLWEATKPEYRHISPLWGFVALEGGMLEALRFYGNYTFDTSNPEQRKNIAAVDDPVAQLILKLFPSPDGETLVPNAYIRDTAGFLSRNLASINEIIRIMLTEDLTDKKTSIINVLRPKKNGIFIYNKGVDSLSGNIAYQFTETLLSAHTYTFANGIPYPKNTAIVALIAFFVSVADKPEDLEKLTFLLKDGFNAKQDLKKFTEKEFFRNLPNISNIMTNADTNPELAMLMNIRTTMQNHIYIPTLSYRVDTKLENQRQFSDCVETSFRNFFWKLSHLSADTLEIFFKNIEKENPLIHEHQPYQKLKIFVLDKEFLGQSTQAAHSVWSQIVSGLNGLKTQLDFNDISYVNSTFEIATDIDETKKSLGGIFNMLNVFAKLIPDSVLSENWKDSSSQNIDLSSQETINKINKKLTRLCSFASPSISYIVNNQLPFLSVTFSYLNNKFIEWSFRKSHFSLTLLMNGGTSWKNSNTSQVFNNEWLGTLFNRYQYDKQNQLPPFKLSYVFNPSIRTLNGLFNATLYVSQHKTDSLKKLIPFWWQRNNFTLTHRELTEQLEILSGFLNTYTDSVIHDAIRIAFARLPNDEKPIFLKTLIAHNHANIIKSMPFLLKENFHYMEINTGFFPLELSLKNLSFEACILLLDLCEEGNMPIAIEDFKRSQKYLTASITQDFFAKNVLEMNILTKIKNHPLWKEKVPYLNAKHRFLQLTQNTLRSIFRFWSFDFDINLDLGVPN